MNYIACKKCGSVQLSANIQNLGCTMCRINEIYSKIDKLDTFVGQIHQRLKEIELLRDTIHILLGIGK